MGAAAVDRGRSGVLVFDPEVPALARAAGAGALYLRPGFGLATALSKLGDRAGPGDAGRSSGADELHLFCNGAPGILRLCGEAVDAVRLSTEPTLLAPLGRLIAPGGRLFL